MPCENDANFKGAGIETIRSDEAVPEGWRLMMEGGALVRPGAQPKPLYATPAPFWPYAANEA